MAKRTLDTFAATAIAEGNPELAGYDFDEMEPEEVEEVQIDSWQLLIDTGLCWQLQGSFGRMATHLIEEGICSAPGE